MKTHRKQERKINSIANGRWTAYATAAAATGLAATHTAEATVHYSGPINQRVAGVHGFDFDLGSGASGLQFHITGTTKAPVLPTTAEKPTLEFLVRVQLSRARTAVTGPTSLPPRTLILVKPYQLGPSSQATRFWP